VAIEPSRYATSHSDGPMAVEDRLDRRSCPRRRRFRFALRRYGPARAAGAVLSHEGGEAG